MEHNKEQYLPFILLHLILLWFSLFVSNSHAFNNSVSAILVFGDSTVDPGNNNYVKTIFKGNFHPYGRDFVNHTPTGRFTNGRLGTDFIASYVGVTDFVPPYLDPSLGIKELMTGVSFASAGSGFDPLTPKISNVVPISKQLESFKEYKKKIESAIGMEGTEEHIRKAIFIVSAGTNDFVINYFTLPIRRKSFSVLAYQQFVIQHVKDFLQCLWAQGARKIAVVGLPPMGCLPIVMTFNSNNANLQRGCIDKYSYVARQFNLFLQNELHFMQIHLAKSGAKLFYVDSYEPLNDMIHNIRKYGFDEVDRGCCGTGYIEASFLCNPKSLICLDVTKYVFWDSMHPTEIVYHNLFKAALPTIDLIIKD